MVLTHLSVAMGMTPFMAARMMTRWMAVPEMMKSGAAPASEIC
ncbi:MAG: hypothetical protein R3D81_04740 [Thalassovita sp.]